VQHPSNQSPGPESDSAASSAPRAHPRDTVPAGAAKLFVGQVPWACSESDLYSLFAPFGKLHEVVIFRNRVSQDRAGYGFVTFESRDDARAAIDALHFKATMPRSNNNLLQVKFADSEGNLNDPKLFVGNLAVDVVEQDLRHIFAPFGEISEIVILRSPDGMARGSGFVRFKRLDSAQMAIENLNNRYDLRGRLLSVSFAEKSKDKQTRKKGPAPLLSSRSVDNSSPYDRAPPQYMSSGPPPSSYGYGSGAPPYYGPPGHSHPQPSYGGPSSFDSVLQGIESRLSSIPPQQPPMGMPMQPPMRQPDYYMGPPAGYPPQPQPQHNYGPPPHMAPQPPVGAWNPSPDNLLSMMMPRPSLPPPSSSSYDPGMQSALGSKQEGPRDSNLFILHFPKDWRNEELFSNFAPFGRIISANIFLDKDTGESRCFGFVSYDNPQSASAAINAMNGQQLGTKRLKVELKRQ